MNTLTFEFLHLVPWLDDGLQDEILYGSGLGPDGSPLMIARIPPDLLRGPGGTLWLTSRGQVVRASDNKAMDIFPLGAADVDAITSIVPTLDEGFVVLGRKDAENILVRLTDTGELLWRKTNPPPLQSNLEHAQLLVDFDGAIYLYTANYQTGQVVRVNLDDGTSSVPLDLGDYRPQKVWVWQGSLFWVAHSVGVYSWISQRLETGRQHAVIPHPSLQDLLGTACAVLPDGGALLSVPEDNELVWMGPDGSDIGRQTVAGIVRANGGLAVGDRAGDKINIIRWSNGRVVDSFQAGPFPVHSDLIYTDQNVYYVLESDKVVAVDSAGEHVANVPFFMVGEQRLQRQGNISITKAVVEPDGAVLLVGADSEGAYVVRITRGNPRN